jgi:hypothetical protein
MGIGLARLLLRLMNTASIREVTLVSRTPTRLRPSQKGLAGSVWRWRKLFRVVRNSLHHGPQRFPELRDNLRSLVFIPPHSLGKVPSRRR